MEPTPRMKPMKFVDLLPGLTGILTKEAIQSIKSREKQNSTLLRSESKSKWKPVPMAELSSALEALRGKSPKRILPDQSARKKKFWNSSVKVEKKTISHTANGRLRNNTVRKVLEMPTDAQIPSSSRKTMISETPKHKDASHIRKKSIYSQAHTNVRISGITAIPDTPVASTPMVKTTLDSNRNVKFNLPYSKKRRTPKNLNGHRMYLSQLDESWKSGSDASFLQKEKEIQDVEDRAQALYEQSLEDINKISPPFASPFNDYRTLKEDLSDLANSVSNTSRDEQSANNIKEPSAIVSICDLINDVAITNSVTKNTELKELLRVKKQTEDNLKMIDLGLEVLTNIKASQLASLNAVTKLIRVKSNETNQGDGMNTTLVEEFVRNGGERDGLNRVKPTNECFGVKSCAKSPTYTIPKKRFSLRKSVVSKSVLDISKSPQSPYNGMSQTALNKYMEIKRRMKFLNTPKKRDGLRAKTPEKMDKLNKPLPEIIISKNLQKQLDKLYNE